MENRKWVPASSKGVTTGRQWGIFKQQTSLVCNSICQTCLDGSSHTDYMHLESSKTQFENASGRQFAKTRIQKQGSRNMMLNCFQMQENASISIKLVSKWVLKWDLYAVWNSSKLDGNVERGRKWGFNLASLMGGGGGVIPPVWWGGQSQWLDGSLCLKGVWQTIVKWNEMKYADHSMFWLKPRRPPGS